MFLLVRWAIRLGITVVILAALAVGADIGGRVLTQDQVAAAAKKSSHAASVKVTISDFPFVYDIAANGRVNRVHVVATDVPAGPITLSEVDLTVNGVVIDRNQLFKGHERFDRIDRATVNVVYQLTPAETKQAAGADITAVPAAGGVTKFEAGGQVVFTLQLASVPLIPACGFQGRQEGTTYTFSCSVAPVPASVLASLSK